MKIIKKMIAAAVITVMAVSLASGCSKRTDPVPVDESADEITEENTETQEPKDNEDEKPSQGMVIPAEDPEASVYLILPSQEGQSAIEAEQIRQKVEAAGIPIIVKSYNRRVDKQTELFEEAIKENASLIICDNADVEYTTEETEKARAAGIPVFLLNRGIDSMGVASSQIITDTYSCVMELGRDFIDEMDGVSNYIEIQGSNASFDITEAFADVMSEGEEMLMVRSDVADETDPQASYDIIWDLINESPEADAVICYNVMQTKAAISAAGDLGRSMKFVCLYGDDDEIVELVNSGKVFASVIKPGDEIAENAAKQVEEYINSGKLPSSELVYIKGKIIKYGGSSDDEDEDEDPEESTDNTEGNESENTENAGEGTEENGTEGSGEAQEDQGEEYYEEGYDEEYVEVDDYDAPAGEGTE